MLTRFLRHIPIKRKLTIITMLTSGVALLVACVAVVVYEQLAFRRTMEMDLSILTDLFDDNVASGLAFNDAKSVTQTLSSLSAHPRLMAAVVYDKAGQVVARYVRPNEEAVFRAPEARETGTRFQKDRLEAFRRVVLDGEMIGTIYIVSDLRELATRFWRFGLIVTARIGSVRAGCAGAVGQTAAGHFRAADSPGGGGREGGDGPGLLGARRQARGGRAGQAH